MEIILRLALISSSLHPVDPIVLWEKFQQISAENPCIKNAKRQFSGKIFFEISSDDFKKLINLLNALSKTLGTEGKSTHFDLYPRDLPGHKITIAPNN